MTWPPPTYQMCGAVMTISQLEAILSLLNANGSVTITGCGHASLMELGAELAALVNSNK